MTEQCPNCGSPLVCLRDRLDVEIADLRDVVALATKQVALRYAAADLAGSLDWREESKHVPLAELRQRREPFVGVNP